MNQLTIVHEKFSNNNTKKQVVSNENKIEEYENKREGHGQNIALTRNVYRLENSDTFYVESESTKNVYYFVRYNPSVFEICSCPDSWIRHVKCKHQFAIEYSIMKGTLKDICKLPKEAKRYNGGNNNNLASIGAKSYRDEDDYDF